MRFSRKLVLEDGQVYEGYGFGDMRERVCELVFNTSMTGYQEIFSDPSYTDQGVVMTYPLIGNYGMAGEDYETEVPTMGAMIVREYNDEPSNFRSAATLSEKMKQFGIPGICGIDTRKLTRSIRDSGSRLGLITDAKTSLEDAKTRLREYKIPHDAVSRVSCKRIWTASGEEKRYHVIAIDCGMKRNIVRAFNKHGCKVTVVPWNTGVSEIEDLKPDGIFLSNGPGNPVDVQEVIEVIKKLRGSYPMFGICLGHQLICLAYGAKTYKLKFGHRGGNHPVRNLSTGKIEITSQNHSYAVEEQSLKGTRLTTTHVNLLDGTVEGVACEEDRVFGVQYHPESAPGPQDSDYLFDCFLKQMEEGREHA